jgi:hypothetical protein
MPKGIVGRVGALNGLNFGLVDGVHLNADNYFGIDDLTVII